MAQKTKPSKSRMRKRIDHSILVVSIIAGLLLYNQFYIQANFREVIDNTVYRSAQPNEKQFRNWIEKYQFKTIVNFRSPEAEMGAEEIAITDELGVELHFIKISAYRVFDFDKLAQLIEVLETCEKPILLHCRQGMDRSGTASAIAAWCIGDQSYNKSKWHSFIPPGPWKRKAKKDFGHVSDTFDIYERYCDQNQLDPAEFKNFKQWAAENAQPESTMESNP